jgi:hypothetical protein
MASLEEIQKKISDYYARGGGGYAGAGELYAKENESSITDWHNLVKERNRQQQKQAPQSPAGFSPTRPNEFIGWDKVRDDIKSFNKMSDFDKVVAYNAQRAERPYVVVDKNTSTLYLFMPGSTKPVFKQKVGIGKNKGDYQTVTKYMDINEDGKITDVDKVNGKFKVDWNAGNMMTGAGRYYVSNIDRKGYGGEPIINMMNEQQYDRFKESGDINNVATSFHHGYVPGQGRASNGCIRSSSGALNCMADNLQNNSEVYILPEDEGNQFMFEGGKLNFRPAQKYFSSLDYIDQVGRTQRGQGLNRSTNTLQYSPLKIDFDEQAFIGDNFSTLDFNDKRTMERTTKPFIDALVKDKREIMKAAKINSEVYNDIAKVAFGIYGAETSYGDTNGFFENMAKLVAKGAGKLLGRDNFGGPDYKMKSHIFGKENHSVGLTQIRWSFLNDDEKAALKKVGITSNKDFNNPRKAAMGTAIVLGVRYNQQLNSKEKEDIYSNLPKTWNRRGNYADRVRTNSKYIKLAAENYFGEHNR